MKTMLRFFLTPERMASLKKSKVINAGEAVVKKEPARIAGVNVN